MAIFLLLFLSKGAWAQEEFSDEPIDINEATRLQLEQSSLFSTFQIESLIEYRNSYGRIASLAELSLVDGFSAEIVEEISPFIIVAIEKIEGLAPIVKPTNQLIVKVKYPLYLYQRYSFKYKQKAFWGFTLESDPGERFPNFVSGYCGIGDLNIGRRGAIKIEKLVFGDFSLRMGQGMVLWNSFPITFISSPGSLIKRESRVTPYTSNDEENYFRGVGATLCLMKMVNLSLFYSFQQLSGYNLSFGGKSFKIGTTAVFYERGETPNKFGLDFDFVFKRFRLFAEGTCSPQWNPPSQKNSPSQNNSPSENNSPSQKNSLSVGKLTGVVGVISNFEIPMSLSILVRYQEYLSLIISLESKLSYDWNIFFSSEYRRKDNRIKSQLKGDWKEGGHSVSLSIGNTIYLDDKEMLWRTRGAYNYLGESGLSLSARVESSLYNKAGRTKNGGTTFGQTTFGALCYQECGYSSQNGGWKLFFRVTEYHADNWDNRIYCYQKDIPRSFSMKAFYGRGVDLSLYFQAKPLRWLQLYLRASHKKINGQISLTF